MDQPLRFVVLHHLLADGQHWDLMLERPAGSAAPGTPRGISDAGAQGAAGSSPRGPADIETSSVPGLSPPVNTLATWQLMADPVGTAAPGVSGPIPARRIGDHRMAYLEYEGPVSRGRGHVRRVDGGVYELVAEQPDRWVLRLAGSRLSGRFALTGLADGAEGIFQRME